MNSRKQPRQKKAMDLEQDQTKFVAKLSPEIKSKIGQQLRVLYEEVVCQGVPERFVEILRSLDTDDDHDHDDPVSGGRGEAQEQ